jgi:hypothetical protein
MDEDRRFLDAAIAAPTTAAARAGAALLCWHRLYGWPALRAMEREWPPLRAVS